MSNINEKTTKKTVVISEFESVHDNKPVMKTTSWKSFIARCSKPEVRGTMKLKEYLAADKSTRDKMKSGKAICCASFKKGSTRKAPNIEEVTLITFDFDEGDITFDELKLKLKELRVECIVHTTYSHSKKVAKLRAFILPDKPIRNDHKSIVSNVRDYFKSKLGAEIDKSCENPAQIFYPPSCPPGAEKYFCFAHVTGKPLHIANFSVVAPDDNAISKTMLKVPQGNRPGDHYNNEASFADILQPLGWKQFFSNDKSIHWTRPGKSKGTSAVEFLDKKVLHVFSSAPEVSPLESGTSYTPFAAYATINHNGDFSAAAADLMSKGYGDADSIQNVEAIERGKIRFPVTEFPLEIFPEFFRELVMTYSRALQCQPAFMAMVFLAIISCAAGNTVSLQIKRKWRVAPFIWFFIAGASGDGKSHPIGAGMEPLQSLQAEEELRYKNEEAGYKASQDEYKRDKDAVAPEPPRPKRDYYTSNFTVEALIAMFQHYTRGVLIYVDELAGLFSGMNQYKGGRGSDNEQFLSLFDCKPLKTDRKGNSQYCKESGCAVIGGIQTKLLPLVFNDQMHISGMAYRFLPMMLPDITRKFTEDDVSASAEIAWEKLVAWMYGLKLEFDTESGSKDKITLKVSELGKKTWKRYYDNLNKQRRFMPEAFSGYLPKLLTYSLKFMSVLQLLECYTDKKVNKKVKRKIVMNAIRLTNYFAGQAMNLVMKMPKEHNPYIPSFKEALSSLKHDVKNGKMYLCDIREKVNKLVPPEMILDDNDKRLGKWLREIGFEVKTSTGNKAVIIWNPDLVL